MTLFADAVDLARFGGASSGIILLGAYSGKEDAEQQSRLFSAADFHRSRNPDAIMAAVLDIESKHKWQDAFPPQYRELFVPIFAASKKSAASIAGLQEFRRQAVLPPTVILHFYGGGYVNQDFGRNARLCCEMILASLQNEPTTSYRLFITGVKVSSLDEANLWAPILNEASVIGVEDEESARCWQPLIDRPDRLFIQSDDALALTRREGRAANISLAETAGFTEGPTAKFEFDYVAATGGARNGFPVTRTGTSLSDPQ